MIDGSDPTRPKAPAFRKLPPSEPIGGKTKAVGGFARAVMEKLKGRSKGKREGLFRNPVLYSRYGGDD
jgi:hypothetical protein